MRHLPPVRAIAVDVLGTLVDEPRALTTTIGAMMPGLDHDAVEAHRQRWERFVAREQSRIARGARPYADADMLDLEAADDLARRAGVERAAARAHAAALHDHLVPWPDAAAGIELLGQRHPVFGLSNATAATLEAVADRAGFAWARAVSAAEAGAYKPAAAVYLRAAAVAGVAPREMLMVAAHAWDLRAARAVGMRTAYVPRPVGDPPRHGDGFDGRFRTLAELADALTG